MPDVRKNVTVLFADIVGSTAMTAEQDPEVIRGVVARYFEQMKRVAELHGGTVEKFIGDAVMVVFGVPRVHEDDAERAVRTALAMRHELAAINAEMGLTLSMRVGINSGETVAAAGDDPQFLTGDPVNVAARLQQGADPDEIVVGTATEQLTRAAIVYEPREPIIAKGKVDPIRAHRVIRTRTTLPEQARGLPSLRMPLVGRTRELSILLDGLARATAQGRARLVTVLGTAGVGKSRLVAEALEHFTQNLGVRVLRGRCLPYGAGITYWPLMDVVRNDAQIALADARNEALAKVDTRLEAILPAEQRPAVRARLAVLLGLESPTDALPGIAAERMGSELAWGLRQYVRAVNAGVELVLIIDDLQWAESSVLHILEQLTEQTSAGPLLLICVARPELLESYPSWAAGREDAAIIRLEPLSDDETRTLLSGLLRTSVFPELLTGHMVERSAGNPLFCEEFVRMLIESGRLVQMADGWQVAGPLDALAVPETIHALIAARIDGLAATEKAALQAASVIGERFGTDQLLALAGAADIGGAPEALVRRGLLMEDHEDVSHRALRFKHLLVRDAAYRSLSKAERARMHDRFGAQLEASVSERLGEFSEILAYHAVESLVLSQELRLDKETVRTRAQRALRWSRVAGDRAFALYATAQAAAHYGRALDIAVHEPADRDTLAHLFANRGRVFELRGEYDRAIATYEEMQRLARSHGDDRMQAEALSHQATVYTTTTELHDPERADRLHDQALRIARASADRALISRLQWNQIHVELWRGRLERALAAGEESLAIAREIDSKEQLAFTLEDISCAYREAGWLEKSMEALATAGTLFGGLDRKEMVANTLSSQAVLEFLRGDYVAALRLCTESQRLADEIGNLWGQAYSLQNSGWVHFERGEFGQAIQNWEACRELAELTGFVGAQSGPQADLSWCYRSSGAPELARQRLAAAHAIVESRVPQWRAWTLAHLSRAATAENETDEAARFLALAEDGLAARSEYHVFQSLQVALAHVELRLAVGDYPGAAQRARTARGELSHIRPFIADLHFLEGEAHRLSGDAEAAAIALGSARDDAAALGSERVLWRVLRSLASVEESRGNLREAEAARRATRAVVERIAEDLGRVGLTEAFLSQSELRDVGPASAPP